MAHVANKLDDFMVGNQQALERQMKATAMEYSLS